DVLEGGEVCVQQLGVDTIHRPAGGDQRAHDAARRGPGHRAEGHAHIPKGSQCAHIGRQADAAPAHDEVDLVGVRGGDHAGIARVHARGGVPMTRSSPERVGDARFAWNSRDRLRTAPRPHPPYRVNIFSVPTVNSPEISRVNSRTALGPRLFAVLVLALALAGAVACTQSPEAKKQKAVERAEVYLKDGKANEAVIELRNALQIDKDYVPALRALARAYAAKAWYGDAIRELGRAKQLNPDSLPIALELGRAYTESGLFREADEQIERVLAREPKNALALYIRAANRLGQGKPDEALNILDGIIAAGQDVPSETAALRAQVLVRLGKKADAEAAYRAAVKQNPSDVQSLVGLGRTHLERGEYTEAEKLFTNAQAVKPADINVRLGLAATAAGQGKMQDAIKMLEGIDARARTPAVVLALAEYYLRAKQPANASALLVAIVERAPSYQPARNLLGMSYLAGNRPDLAIVHFEELRKQIPGHPVAQ